MGIYIFLMTISLLASTFNNYLVKRGLKKIIFLIICIILVGISSFRDYSVGRDTEQYVRAFYGSIGFIREYELGFTYLIEILRNISSNYLILNFVSSVIILIPIAYLIYTRSPNPFFSVFCLICLNYYSMFLTAMRQSLALGILIIGYIISKKYQKKIYFLLSILTSINFHYTSIVALVYLLLDQIKFTFKRFLLMMFIIAMSLPTVYFVFYSLANFFQVLHYDEYITSVNFSSANYYGMLIKCTLSFALVCFIYIGRYSSKIMEKDKLVLNKYLNFAAISTALTLMATQAVVLERLVMYFDFLYIVSLPFSAQLYKNRYRPIVYYILSFVLILHWLIVAIYRPEWHGVIPYRINSYFW